MKIPPCWINLAAQFHRPAKWRKKNKLNGMAAATRKARRKQKRNQPISKNMAAHIHHCIVISLPMPNWTILKWAALKIPIGSFAHSTSIINRNCKIPLPGVPAGGVLKFIVTKRKWAGYRIYTVGCNQNGWQISSIPAIATNGVHTLYLSCTRKP